MEERQQRGSIRHGEVVGAPFGRCVFIRGRNTMASARFLDGGRAHSNRRRGNQLGQAEGRSGNRRGFAGWRRNISALG